MQVKNKLRKDLKMGFHGFEIQSFITLITNNIILNQ